MEFPQPDPPPTTFVPVNNYSQSGYFSPPAVPSFSHPSYQEMISSAIVALNEKDGSSRQAIAKYIENHFKIVPSQTHGYELTQQLKRMKNCGQLVLNKHSYMFPGSVTMSMPPSGSIASGGFDAMGEAQGLVLDDTNRRPGRPPKLQPNGGLMGPVVGFENQQVGGAVFGVPTVNLFGGLNSGEFQFGGGHVSNDVNAPVTNDVTAVVSDVVTAPVITHVTGTVSDAPTMVYNGGAMYDAGAVANVVPIEQTDVVMPAKRGRGRPRKAVTSAVGAESVTIVVPAGADAQNNVRNVPPVVTPPTVLGKRRRGRPAKLDMTRPVVNGGTKEGQGGKAMVLKEGKRGRGRPRKNAVGANGAGGVLPVAKKPRKVSGRPVGRPRKNALQTARLQTASLTSEMQMVAYEGLKGRVEHYQSRIKTAISVVKPYLNETAVIALGALQDLEELANMDIISVPPSVQGEPLVAVDVQSAPVDVQGARVNVYGAPVDLNAPVNVLGTAHENIQSAPLTAEAELLAFQSAATGETQSTFQSAPEPLHGQ